MAHTPLLFQPISFRSVTARNRIAVAPMCQYVATDGTPDDWHVQHLGARAMGGAGIVFTEASSVNPVGRITPGDLGLYNDVQQAAFARLAAIITRGGAVPGIQIAHAGRKASSTSPWEGDSYIPIDQGGWRAVAPSGIAFPKKDPTPHALTTEDISVLVQPPDAPWPSASRSPKSTARTAISSTPFSRPSPTPAMTAMAGTSPAAHGS
jgi:2,4-dienoyl-CoA reductase-like NADH-dependent reductase (Old Yellow Enzyme family)